jgi:aspartyl-tRNA synthetase
LDPLTGAPTPITPQQRAEAGVDAKPKPEASAAGHAPGTAGGAAPVEHSS